MLRRVWSRLPLRRDGRPAWPAPLLPVAQSPERLEREVRLALEEGSLLPIERLGELSDALHLVLFDGTFEEPAAVVTDLEVIEAYRKAVDYVEPLLFEREALFGPFFWKLTEADEVLDDEHLRLEFLDAVDAERRRYERLKRRYEHGSPSVSASKRERIPEDVRMFVWRRDEGRCVACGSQEQLEFDHVIPVSRGGSSSARNVQLLCERCNRAKGATV